MWWAWPIFGGQRGRGHIEKWGLAFGRHSLGQHGLAFCFWQVDFFKNPEFWIKEVQQEIWIIPLIQHTDIGWFVIKVGNWNSESTGGFLLSQTD